MAVGDGMPFERALEAQFHRLGDADRRLTHELVSGVLRQSGTLDAALAPLISRGINSVAAATLVILRLGAYQLLCLDRVPRHAAVSTTVDLTRQQVGEPAAGFVNAVMRRLSARAEPPAPEDPVDGAYTSATQLAARYAHPPWLVARWVERFGAVDTERLLDWNNSHPALVVQPARSSADDLAQQFTRHGVEYFAAPFDAGLVVSVTRPALLPGFADGAFLVQDAAQALVARFAAFPQSALVYDSCAAPGGKTLSLSAGGATVIAADISRRRIRRLRDNLRRAGRGTELPIVADAEQLPVRPVQAMLLDAPCLGTGTFARHPDARLRVSQSALRELAAQQAALLDAAASRVAPGGVLCYATCSLEPEENEMQVDQFLQRHDEFVRRPSATVPASLLTPAGDLQTLPQQHGVDGAFAARLVRQR